MGTYDLTTSTNVKSFEGIEGDNYDTLISSLIENVTSVIENYCDRQFLGRDYDYSDDTDNAVLDGLFNKQSDNILILPQYPIVSVTTVRINETAYDESTSIYESGWFIYSKKKGMLGLRGYDWLAGAQNIELVYNAGYATIPSDLELACIEQVIWSLKKGFKEHLLGVASVSVADQSVAYHMSNALLPSVKAVLDNKYKKVIGI